ncbi:pyrophosphate--fructose 6-phosphate 1-phosphotransferase subunit alpha-like isoform X2 [Iris pallida]|uniref:Pyrophosphate--fructose 6-phosphate 1-phosphotransferase subunit alpha-like isoform X2 n=1 Tax=Iris pallida TaxID=29817 RepID=A0AAX6ER80_IRIPA|nr:pyrophosphate--fructose 6-phosphate 1-phosphotransferase subunit alpha-like isoform X2 [Iris pallida]
MREGVGSMPIFDYGVGSRKEESDLQDVVVPRDLVPAIYGEDGYCLKQIREISEAKITIIEPRPEALETIIIISGTPEQAHATQSSMRLMALDFLFSKRTI